MEVAEPVSQGLAEFSVRECQRGVFGIAVCMECFMDIWEVAYGIYKSMGEFG